MCIKLPVRRRCSGVSYIELLFTLSIGALVTLAVVAFSLYTGRGFAMTMNYVELESQSTRALDRMIKEIRQTDQLIGYATNQLDFLDSDAKTLSYLYSPTARSLTRTKDGVPQVLLTGCDALSFSIYQRNLTNSTYDQYPTSLQASNTKVIQINWICSRQLLGMTNFNTESVQTAKIVIRNQ